MNHQGTARLETRRLVLRPFTVNDAEQMFCNWASDSKVTKYLSWPAHPSVEVSRQVLESWAALYPDPDYYQWAVELKEIGEPIGSMGAVKVDGQTKSVTMGYCIGSSWWGKGITAEALRAVIVYLFEETGTNCVNACHDPRNPNSGKVMRKCGMTYEGTWRAGGVNNQGVCDESWYSILRSEYEQKTAQGLERPYPDPAASQEQIWELLYQKARKVQYGRRISDYVEAGAVAAAVQAASGDIYTGVCVDSACTLGICAERNAIFQMLTQGEHEIRKVLAVMPDGRTGPPCGACRELMVQLMPDTYADIEIMLDYEKRTILTLGVLTPEWWISKKAFP